MSLSFHIAKVFLKVLALQKVAPLRDVLVRVAKLQVVVAALTAQRHLAVDRHPLRAVHRKVPLRSLPHAALVRSVEAEVLGAGVACLAFLFVVLFLNGAVDH